MDTIEITVELDDRLADANGWGLGETLEQAVMLLKREFGREGERPDHIGGR